MWQAMLGFDVPLWVKFLVAFAVLLALFSGLFYVARRFGGGALGGSPGTRGRQPRLAVIDAATVDTRRKLVLIRRDNVEHLIMIGGPTDVLIEPNIVRATPAGSARDVAPIREAPAVREAPAMREAPALREAPPLREAALARGTPSLSEPPPRTVPLADGGHWPLQPEAPVRPQRAAPPPPPAPPPLEAVEPEPEKHDTDWSAPDDIVDDLEPVLRDEPPSVRSEPPLRAEPPPGRTEPPLRAEPPPVRAEPVLRAVPDPERAERPERPQRAARMQNSDRLSGLAADLSRTFMDDLSATPPQPPPSPPTPPPSPPRRAADARRPAPTSPVQPVASVQPLSEAEEQNLTEMAQRLESALQRPRPAPEPAAPAAAAPVATSPVLRAVELPRIEPVRIDMKPARPEPMAPPTAAAAPVATRPAVKPAPAAAAPKPAAAKPAFGTLEQEMASLLGRSSSGKT